MNDADNISPEEGSHSNKSFLNDLNRELNEGGVPAEEAAFEKDSAEGLKHITAEQIPVIVEQLNAGLRRQLKKKKERREMPDRSFIYITAVIILLIIVAAFFVIKKMKAK